jgi:hypothetical protein
VNLCIFSFPRFNPIDQFSIQADFAENRFPAAPRLSFAFAFSRRDRLLPIIAIQEIASASRYVDWPLTLRSHRGPGRSRHFGGRDLAPAT